MLLPRKAAKHCVKMQPQISYIFSFFTLWLFLIELKHTAMMVFQTIPSERKVKKFVHMTLHLIAIVLGIVGLNAVFKFHDMQNIPNVYSLHSWIGIGTFCLFALQVPLLQIMHTFMPSIILVENSLWHGRLSHDNVMGQIDGYD